MLDGYARDAGAQDTSTLEGQKFSFFVGDFSCNIFLGAGWVIVGVGFFGRFFRFLEDFFEWGTLLAEEFFEVEILTYFWGASFFGRPCFL